MARDATRAAARAAAQAAAQARADLEFSFNNLGNAFDAPFRNPKLNFSSARFAPTRSTFSNVDLEALQTDSVHMPLMPK